jgi:diguanylate cyclase (GGDEF)-like protein
MTTDEDSRTPAEQLEQELKKLRADFAKKLPQRIQTLVEDWDAVKEAGWTQDGVRALHRSVHGLIGTAGSLGFTIMTKTARRLEHQLVVLLKGDKPPSAEDNAAVAVWFEKIGEAAAEDALEEVRPGSIDIAFHGAKAVMEPRNLIVVVEEEESFSDELAHQLEHFGFDLKMYNTVDDVAGDTAGRTPAAVILVMSSQTDELNGVTAATAVRAVFDESVPVVFLSNRSDIEARLDAVRAGCSGYFVKPVNYRDVLETLDRITRSEPEPYRILIVDDEEDAAEYHSVSLRAAGLSTVIVTDPLDVSSQLVEFQPDVILMDVYMPGCSGVELARVIRQEETFIGVPIVFLSRETDRMKQIVALGEGGDDFFTKPVAPNELVPVISARAERSRTLRTLMERDGLTGLYSHSRIIEHIESAVRRAERQQGELAVAMLDIDGFKVVNDTHGHLVGDQVLKALAYLLRQHLRLSDVLGRFGGDEFVILLPDTDGVAAVEKIEEIRQDFAAIDHDTGRGLFSVTVSCGVAEYPTALSCHELIAAADDALYGAKRAGRNRVALAGEDI